MCDKAADEEDVKEEHKRDESKVPSGGVDWDTQMEFMEGELESSLSDGNTSKTTVIVNFKVGYAIQLTFKYLISCVSPASAAQPRKRLLGTTLQASSLISPFPTT